MNDKPVFYDAAEYGDPGTLAKEGVPFDTWHRDGYGSRDSNRLEMEITTDCNLKCVHCDRSCRQAPSKENMSVEQIKRFVDDSLANEFFWYVIKFAGGEPTQHPQFREIVEQIGRYKRVSPRTRIWLNTNGFGERAEKQMEWAESLDWIYVNSSNKTTPNVTHHHTYNLAPRDYGLVAPPCHRAWDCGMGLSRYGFYPCGAGAAIDRVFGFDIGIKCVADLGLKPMLRQCEVLCPYCGKSPTKVKRFNEPEEMMSISWVEGYARYKDNPSELTTIYE